MVITCICRERKIAIPNPPHCVPNATYICRKCYAALFNALLKCAPAPQVDRYMAVIKFADTPQLSLVKSDAVS